MKKLDLDICGSKIIADVAETDDQIQKGLMGRVFMPDSYGMLFVFENPQPLSFWMRNTLIPLDIAFISETGHIENISQMKPLSDDRHKSVRDCKYALEVNAGVFDKLGISQGDKVDNLPEMVSENLNMQVLRKLIKESLNY